MFVNHISLTKISLRKVHYLFIIQHSLRTEVHIASVDIGDMKGSMKSYQSTVLGYLSSHVSCKHNNYVDISTFNIDS